VAEKRVKALPQAEVFPEGSIATAGHVAKDAIEFELLFSFLVYSEERKAASIMASNEKGRRFQSMRLVSQHVSSFRICIVSNDESLWPIVLAFVQVLQNLDRF